VTEVLKALHRIVNEAIRAAEPGDDHAEGLKVDLSKIDFAKLRDEFKSKVRRKHAALQDIRDVVEKKLAQMLAHNPMRMDYYKKYQEIIADYNREKDRVTVEETFAKLIDLANSLDAEQRRASEEGLSEDELAMFDLLFRENISKSDRERLKQASKGLLASLREILEPMPAWTQNTATQAEVKVFILDNLWRSLPRPPFTDQETAAVAIAFMTMSGNVAQAGASLRQGQDETDDGSKSLLRDPQLGYGSELLLYKARTKQG
jgi:type I restriction enzyme R subunit